jgi:hypothetical protein
MKTHSLHHTTIAAAAIAFAILTPASAKDEPIQLEKCPQPVQAVIRSYETQGKLEEVALDEKKKTGGPAVYEAKFTLTGGRRIELHISPAGSVIQIEEKKRKN